MEGITSEWLLDKMIISIKNCFKGLNKGILESDSSNCNDRSRRYWRISISIKEALNENI
jgi:hypothetical protein